MTPETWAIVELMGHVRHAGRLTEEEKFGGKLGRLDIPLADGAFATKYFGAASVYSITVVSEEAARIVAQHTQPQPVHSWEMPKPNVLPQLAPPAEANNLDDDPQFHF